MFYTYRVDIRENGFSFLVEALEILVFTFTMEKA